MNQREWTTIRTYEDILFEYHNGIGKITINRPHRRNAFTPVTVAEMGDALRLCREMNDIRVVALTGAGDKARSGHPLRPFRRRLPARGTRPSAAAAT